MNISNGVNIHHAGKTCTRVNGEWKTDNKRLPVHRFTKMGLLSFEQQFNKCWAKA